MPFSGWLYRMNAFTKTPVNGKFLKPFWRNYSAELFQSRMVFSVYCGTAGNFGICWGSCNWSCVFCAYKSCC
jgi:hypothetical protein